jgi:hypothetical protein
MIPVYIVTRDNLYSSVAIYATVDKDDAQAFYEKQQPQNKVVYALREYIGEESTVIEMK